MPHLKVLVFVGQLHDGPNDVGGLGQPVVFPPEEGHAGRHGLEVVGGRGGGAVVDQVGILRAPVEAAEPLWRAHRLTNALCVRDLGHR